MTKSSQKTWLNLGIVAAIGFVLWKLWPTIKKGLGGGFSSGGGGVAGASPQYPYPNQDNSQKLPSLPPLSFGSGGGSGSGSGGGGGLAAFVNSVLNQGYSNAQSIPNTEDTYLGNLDQQGIPLEPVQNLDNLPSYSYNDPNAPWNNDTSGTDVQSYDLGGVALDNSGGGSYDNSGSGTPDQVDYTSYDSSGDY